MTLTAVSEKNDSFLKASLEKTLDKCTSIKGTLIPDSASLIDTELWVNAAGLMIIKSDLRL